MSRPLFLEGKNVQLLEPTTIVSKDKKQVKSNSFKVEVVKKMFENQKNTTCGCLLLTGAAYCDGNHLGAP